MPHLRLRLAAALAVALAATASVAYGLRMTRQRRRLGAANADVASTPKELPVVGCDAPLLCRAMQRAGVPATSSIFANAPLTCVPPETMDSDNEEECAETAAYFAVNYFGKFDVEPPRETWKWLFPQRPAKATRRGDADDVRSESETKATAMAMTMSASEMPHVNTLALFSAPSVLRAFLRRCADFVDSQHATALVAYESRAVAFAASVAATLALPLVPVYKDNDTCARTQYNAVVENVDSRRFKKKLTLDINALPRDARVVVICDVVNSGGTIAAVVELLLKHGTNTVGVFTLVDFRASGGAATSATITSPVLQPYAYEALASL
jgi:adenine/guanine phosphoribosyltransferase-like PRPP-binding protein